MKVINLLLLSSLAASGMTVSMVQAKEGPVRAFLKKHKKKIIAGVAAAAAVGGAILLGAHANKTMTAIKAAGLTSSDDEYTTALLWVGLLGPVGKDRAGQLIDLAVQKGVIKAETKTSILCSKVGEALGKYWGVGTAASLFGCGKTLVKGLTAAVKEEGRAFLSWAKKELGIKRD